MSEMYYIHTINGKPGWFVGGQICYMNHYGRGGNKLVKSLKQIRKEQAATKAYREKKFGPDNDEEGKYGYKRVYLP